MHTLTINTDRRGAVISRHIFGHFSEHLGRCIYGGLYVGEDSAIPNVRGMRSDVVAALRNIRIPNLRWPGGCFADEYHWRDGIGPREARKRMVNTHWGGVVEDNSFGTHEFLDLCAQLGCEPYINGNVGSGTVQEMQEWVEYMTFDGESPMARLRAENGQKDAWRVKYFGVGNENWGCGGNMRPEYYADEYRRYQTYVRNYGENKIFRIACGPSVDDYNWSEVLMREAGRYMDALTLHHYTVPGTWQNKGPATGFDTDAYYATMKEALRMETLISGHLQIMHRHDPEHRVGLIVDEWGTWFDVEPGTNPGFLYQQNTMRDAMVAATTLDIFARHADRVIMANLAQLVNVLQSPILTDGEKMLLTPTYHVFDLYKEHQDATLLDQHLVTDTIGPEALNMPRLTSTASVAADSTVHVTVTNLAPDAEAEVRINLAGMTPKAVAARMLHGAMGEYNTFEKPEAVKVRDFDGVAVSGGTMSFTLPPCGVVALSVKA